jgi:hypothetical protein
MHRAFLALAFALAAGAAAAQSPIATPVPPAAPAAGATGSPWDNPAAWLCRPGRDDACAAPQAVTRIAADGRRSTEVLRPAADAPFDCFYVYPTISEDPEPNSPLAAGPGERRAVAQQFAPFASVCRPFAPLYRQVTLAGLRAAMGGQPAGIDAELPVQDVRAAWRHYLANDNRGRGVLLVGHSQGSRMLIELLKRDIEGQPAQRQLVAAYLIGLNVVVPAGATTGGTFAQLQPCRSGDQVGCVVSYASFRASAPPPANARFGRARDAGTEVVCTDPVALSGQPAQAWLPREANLLGQPLPAAWQQGVAGVDTPFVDLPGLLRLACVRDGAAHYLAVATEPAAPGAGRPAEVPGDLVAVGRVFPDWGLHLVDLQLPMGNLLALAKRQGAAWRAQPR